MYIILALKCKVHRLIYVSFKEEKSKAKLGVKMLKTFNTKKIKRNRANNFELYIFFLYVLDFIQRK